MTLLSCNSLLLVPKSCYLLLSFPISFHSITRVSASLFFLEGNSLQEQIPRLRKRQLH
jgi:hypothetical protein